MGMKNLGGRMKQLLMTLLLFVALDTQASNTNFELTKPLPSMPHHTHTELGKIWDTCFAKAEQISFNQGSAILSNAIDECAPLNLKEIFFDYTEQRFTFSTPHHENPFASLRNSKINLYAKIWSFNEIRTYSNSSFIPLMTFDMRMNAITNGVPTDIFISQRTSTVGWRKTAQKLVAKETRTDWCRPNIQCTYAVNIYQQTWKSDVTGEITVRQISE